MAINSLNASSHGLSGLVSGIGSQDMVEKLLMGTQTKIDKASQKKTQLQYKQQMYRDVATKLRTLQSSYLSFTSTTNLLSNSFYNSMNATVTPPKGASAAFSVSASSSAKVGNTSMEWISQLASARYAKSTNKVSGSVSGAFDTVAAQGLLDSYSGADADLTIKVGSHTFTINDVAAEFGGLQPSDVADRLNAIMVAPDGVTQVAEARYVNNKLEIIAANKDDYIVFSGNTAPGAKDSTMAMRMFGNVSTLSGQGTFTASIDTDNYMPGFVVNLDGREQTIRMHVDDLRNFISTGDATQLTTNLGKSLERAFGSGVGITLAADNKSFALTSGSNSQKFTVTGSVPMMGMLGIKSGISNKLNADLAIKDLNFSAPLQGSVQRFSINGYEFSFGSDATLNSIMREINNSKAGVKVSYIESEDRFRVENTATGKGTPEIQISQSEGNLMHAMFGVAGGNSAAANSVNKTLQGVPLSGNILAQIAEGGTFTFNVNGSDYRFTLSRDKDDPYFTPDVFAAKMNESFATTFGKMADGTQSVEFTYVNGAFQINANNPDYTVKVVKQDDDTNKSTLGFAVGDSTVVTDKTTDIGDLGIGFGSDGKITMNVNGFDVSLTAADFGGGVITMADIADKLTTKVQAEINRQQSTVPPLLGAGDFSGVKVEYDERTAAFRVVGVDIPLPMTLSASGGEDLDKLLGGAGSVTVGQAGTPLSQIEGQNAIFKMGGSDAVMERASNTFVIDGLTFTLHSTTFKDPTNTGGPSADPMNPDLSLMELATHISVVRDTDKIVDGIMEFLELYNETVDYINELYRADASYKDYPPLTAKQKESMGDRDIENWEKKSQEGLLRNDQNLEKILQSLRTAMYTKPEGSSIAIYDLGINTSYYTKDGNFNAENRDALKAAIEADPEAVRRLFAGEGGIMELVNDAITEATKSSYASPGYLVRVAGSNSADTSSSIYKQIKEIDGQLSTLETRYWSEYNRYWKQFNTLEQIIQQTNNQMSWLSQQLGGGTQ